MKFNSIKKNEFQNNKLRVDYSDLSISDEQLMKLIDESMSKALGSLVDRS